MGKPLAQVERVVGLWALGAILQTWDQVGQPDATPEVARIRRQWTTSGRLSVWARGQFALQDRSGHLRAWLIATLTEGAQRVAATPLLMPRTHYPPASPASVAAYLCALHGTLR